MQPSRSAVALVILLIFSGLSAAGAAQTDLEEARRAEAEARQQRALAEEEAGAAAATRNDLGSKVEAALAEYQATNLRLEQLGLSLAGLRHDLDVAADEVSTLRESAHEQAAQAYMRTVGGGSILLSSSFEALAVFSASVARASEDNVATYEALEERRAELGELRTAYEADKETMADLDDLLAAQLAQLQALFAEADTAMLIAFETLSEADAAYEAAQASLAEAERKYRWTGSVEQWRTLVEQYFPPELVDEALRVMACESGGNPNAKNPHSSATGLFQFLSATWAWSSVSAGWGGYSRLDPEANIAVAAWLVERSISTNHPGGAWGHWECQP